MLVTHGLPVRLARWLLLAAVAAMSARADTKPGFSGIWKLSGSNPPQFLILDQSAVELRVFEFSDDRLTIE
jgi:hypothetical protein